MRVTDGGKRPLPDLRPQEALEGRYTPTPPCSQAGTSRRTFWPSADSPYSTPVAKAMALPSSVVRVRLMTTEQPPSCGRSRSRGRPASTHDHTTTSCCPGSPSPCPDSGHRKGPRASAGTQAHNPASQSPQTPMSLSAEFCALGENPRLSSDCGGRPPWWLSGKDPLANSADTGLIPNPRRSPYATEQ